MAFFIRSSQTRKSLTLLPAVASTFSLRETMTCRVGKKIPPILVVLLVPNLSACPNLSMSPEDLTKPKDVSVSSAFEEIGKGFKKLGSELDGTVLGVLPCKITMSFAVKASATEDNTLAIGVSEAPVKIVDKSLQSDGSSETDSPGFGAVATTQGGATANRNNTISIELYNPGCLPEKTLGYEKPGEVDDAMAGMLVTADMAFQNLNVVGRRAEVSTKVSRGRDTVKSLK